MAFGTGGHETTSLCIKNLEKYVQRNDNIIDVGCGSGILSIAASYLTRSFHKKHQQQAYLSQQL